MRRSEERQLARKQHLRDYCLKHEFKTTLTTPEDFYFLAVDDDLKIIYCVIPTVGTTKKY